MGAAITVVGSAEVFGAEPRLILLLFACWFGNRAIFGWRDFFVIA